MTSGPIAWDNPIPGKDGKKIFVAGSTLRGELVRFDAKTRQFLPYLAVYPADNMSFSKDGKSVVFISYPEWYPLESEAGWQQSHPTERYSHAAN